MTVPVSSEEEKKGGEDHSRRSMEEGSSVDTEDGMRDHLLDEDEGKGGIRAIPTIFGIETAEEITSYGLPPNMILYLTKDYHMKVINGNTIIYIWKAASSFCPVVGAFIADSYLGRFTTIAIGAIFSLLGLITLLLTSIVPGLQPPQCSTQDQSCTSATSFQVFILCAAFFLLAIGTGGIRSSSLAFGADQLRKRAGQRNSKALEVYFGIYYGLVAISVFIATTVIVTLQEKKGWTVGFGVPIVLMFVAAVAFFLASSLYLKLKVKTNLLMGLVQVGPVAFKRKHIELPSESTDTMFLHREDSLLTKPTENLRCLNKACLIINPEQELNADGTAKDPWNLCTVDQVEELKALIRVIPLWSTGVLMFTCIDQTVITVLQAKTMNRKFGSYNIAPGSFGTFQMIGVVMCIVLYQRVFLRVASKVKGKPVKVSAKRRMGVGVFASFLAMVAAAIVEGKRRSRAISEGDADKPNAQTEMSAIWLVPQLALVGMAEAFNAVAQNQFYYSEFPRSMSSIAASLLLLGMAVADLLASLIQNIIDDVTKKQGQSWISDNINQGHYDYYYWVLAAIATVNVVHFLISSKLYGPMKEQMKEIPEDQGDDYPRFG